MCLRDRDLAADLVAEDPIEEEPVDSEDPELDEIFVMEANERIEVIDQFLASPGAITGDLVAAFHTLKGSGAMVGVESIAAVAAPLEQLSNIYLTNHRDADESILSLIEKGNTLIKAVTADLATYRHEIGGMKELIAEIEAAGTHSPEVVVEFNFENIRVLSEQNVVDTAWEGDNHADILSELEGAFAQAESLGQLDLATLIQSLLRIYDHVESAPGEDLIAALESGHSQLVRMLDHIAASQEVESANDIVAELDAFDLTTAEEVETEDALVDEGWPEESLPDEPVTSDSEAQDVPGQALPEDEIDEDILPIFLEEAEELLEGIDQSILEWSEDSAQTGGLDLLLRHLHTLKGGSRMAGLNSLGEFTHNFETFLIGVQQEPIDFDQTFFALLNEHQDEITRRVEIYQKLERGQATEEELASLKFEQPIGAGSASSSQPELEPDSEVTVVEVETIAPITSSDEIDLPADEIDEDIMPIFLEETEELLEGIDESIQGWSEETTNPEFLNNLLRHLHTLKGGARMAGMNSLGEFTHNFETFLIGLQQNPVDLNAGFFALLNQRQDEITRRVGIYSNMVGGSVSEEELASLTKDVSGEAIASVSEEQSSTEEPREETAKPDTSKAGQAAPSQEMVRVSADLLEELEGLAGESSITRGRVEQQIQDFGESLQEMEETIHRIRDQVRRLEIEAESRETLLRSQSSKDSGFDELEMDRYTMLQEISRSLNESSSDLLDLKETLVSRSRDTETLLHQQARIASELQEGLTRTRMVPFARLIPRLRRIVRQISAEIGKSVRFDAFNIEGELDRNVLERIVAPLEHMLRNSVDHGIESVEKRKEVGKPEEGRISLRLSREGGYVILNISDDGGGINVDAVRAKAIERGLMTEESALTDNDIMQFILNAGFSTAQKVTQISGRGVGMDVVVSEIKSLGGSISIDSSLGVGTEFTIRIPFTVSINRALMVVVKEEIYAVPLNTIEGIVRVSPYELEAYYQPDAPMFEYAGQPYHLDYMGKLLEKSDVPDFTGQVAPLPVLLARSGENAVALQVDKVIGSREVVVKTLGPQFNGVGGVAGATVLGDGSVVIILDVMALVRTHEIQSAEGTAGEMLIEPKAKVRTIMIVDDSVTVRKVTTRLMERQGWEVETAKDGLDAVNQLQEIYPDVMLLDIEMPKMDGFEVLRRVRHDERLKDLPIIMITSRTGEKHKQEALELGVNRYLGKPFQEANLLSTIEEVIGEAKLEKP
jgi:chemosensory pili system protein ChpA (sensor histidine kinase/response regulator)